MWSWGINRCRIEDIIGCSLEQVGAGVLMASLDEVLRGLLSVYSLDGIFGCGLDGIGAMSVM